MSRLESLAAGEKQCRWQATWDFQNVPAGEFVDLIVEHHSPALYLRRGEQLDLGCDLPSMWTPPS